MTIKNHPGILLAIAVLVLAGTLSPGVATGPVAQKDGVPDLEAARLSVQKVTQEPNRTQGVTVRAVIRNIAKGISKTGTFKVNLFFRDGKSGTYKFKESRLIKSLDTRLQATLPARTSLKFSDQVPPGTTRYYKLEIDPERRIRELSDQNNIVYAEYINPNPRTIQPGDMQMQGQMNIPPCEGVDLIVYSVEINRNDRGQIFLRARIKNLCADTCNGPLELVIDESATGGVGISTSLGSAISGETLAPWSGWLGVHYRDSGDNTYTVSIRVGPPCVDRNPGNNDLPVTLRAGEDRKTVNYGD